MSQNIENIRVKELRGNLSLKEFSLPLEVSADSISKIETGKIGLSIDMAKKICKEYNVSMAWLFGEINERMPVTVSVIQEPKPDYKLMQKVIEQSETIIELQKQLLTNKSTELESLKNGGSAVVKP